MSSHELLKLDSDKGNDTNTHIVMRSDVYTQASLTQIQNVCHATGCMIHAFFRCEYV
jgi:hypothetical protein